MPSSKLSRVQDKGQVTIPSDMRKRLGLKKGDLVAFVETEEGILITPREVIALDALEKLGEILRENGVTIDEWMESTHEIRGQIVKEKYQLDETAE